MSIGSILVGIAFALVLGAYLARPFRTARAGAGLDRAIEAWVAQARAEGQRSGVEEPVSFCSQCGRRVGPDDRFCARCGTPLQERGE
jgi:uncharacterized paraquat-inducible protein A